MKTRVMIVDDQPMMRDGVRSILACDGNVDIVGEAGSGQEAVRLAPLLRPDVIVMDVAMSDMSGVEATRRITHELVGVKVVALSMYNNNSFIDLMREAGAVAYVLKDRAFEDLPATLQTVAAGPAARGAARAAA